LYLAVTVYSIIISLHVSDFNISAPRNFNFSKKRKKKCERVYTFLSLDVGNQGLVHSMSGLT
jgi:hypothetical protein